MKRAMGRWFAAAGLALGMSVSAHAAVSQNGLIVYFQFNETSGTAAKDSSANALNATLKGTGTFAAGKFGNALKVTGVGYAEVPNNAKLNVGGDQITMEAWVNITALADGYSAIMGRADTYMIHLDVPGRTAGTVGIEPFAWPTVEWPPVLKGEVKLGEWTHVAGVFDGKTRTVFINGKNVSSGPHTGAIPNTTAAFAVGYDNRGCCGTRKMDALIDEARLWSRALTAAEVAELAAGPLATAVDPQGKMASSWAVVKASR